MLVRDGRTVEESCDRLLRYILNRDEKTYFGSSHPPYSLWWVSALIDLAERLGLGKSETVTTKSRS